jgi:hypothetical protein
VDGTNRLFGGFIVVLMLRVTIIEYNQDRGNELRVVKDAVRVERIVV